MRARWTPVLVLMLCFCATSLRGQTVTPLIGCWYEDSSKGILTIVFGYTNSSASTVSIPLGVLNFVSPTLADYGQPTSFSPGTFHNVFRMAVPVADEGSVSWTLDGSTAVLNRGGVPSTCTDCFCAPGDIGPAGPTGATGPQGFQGPAGPPGAVGTTGPVGATGATGSAGLAGPSGAVGAAGAAGPTGTTGATGPVGATGVEGIAGIAGAAGAAGAEGAVGPAGAAGVTGPQGVAGMMGPTGPTGAPGAVGVTGAIGATGAEGFAGEIGAAGAAGPAGAAGAEGVEGSRGDAGERGPQGPRGETGEAGPFGSVGAPGASGPRGADALPAILETLPLTEVTEVVLERTADLVVVGSVAARALDGGVVRVRIAGESFAVRVPAGGEWLSLPLTAGTRLAAGRWNVELIAGEGVEIRQPSITVLIEPAGPTARRHSVDH